MIDLLSVGMDSWIIQDGNYGDFKVGELRAFALELYTERLEDAAPPASMKPIGDNTYDIVGQVVHVTGGWWVLDAGVAMFCQQAPPSFVKNGAWLGGAIQISVDPFSYFERLAEQDGAPALIYDWAIEAIDMQTAPLIEVKPRLTARDPSLLPWRAISETFAWGDDERNATYLLRCRRLASKPRRTRPRLDDEL
jgi:hypothetical protein